jgi:SAM-dependent methyltransferase
MNAHAFYDAVAERYDAHRGFYDSLARALVALVPERLAPKRILEIGAGTGFATRVLVERFPAAEIVALEPSNAMRQRGRVAAPSARWRAGTLAELGSTDGFDLIVASAAAHWFTDEEWGSLVSGAARAALALALPLTDARTESGALPQGNYALRNVVGSWRPSPTWNAATRRRASSRWFEALGTDVTTAKWRLVETYAGGAELAEALFVRGALLALFGEDAESARETLAGSVGPGPVDFGWSFLLIGSVPE